MRLLLPLVLLNLTACNLVPPPEPSVPTDAPKAAMAPYTVNEYVANLTSQLNHVNSALNANARIGVSSFFYADALDTKLVAGQASGLSLQIQESLLTQFTQLGYHTVEYRLGNNLILAQNADSILFTLSFDYTEQVIGTDLGASKGLDNYLRFDLYCLHKNL